jgi:hypothetical protein
MKKNVMKKNQYTLLILGGLLSSFSLTTQAADVLPNGVGNMNDIVVPNATPQPLDKSKTVRVNVSTSCFGTNLRSVDNPIAPDSIITATLQLGSDSKVISLKVGESQSVDLINHVFYSINQAGEIRKTGDENAELKVKNWAQTVPGGGGGKYMARDGAVAPVMSQSTSANGSVINVHASFAGQYGFCGGYYSPLMVFFNEDRPQFTGQSLFPLNPSQIASWWPEANAPGYFLAMDRNGDGKISEAQELFGPQDASYANGFEHLRLLDSNKDGVIDWKDEAFEKIVLWKDKNADGKSQSDELFSIRSMQIEFLSLRYEDKVVTPIEDRAELRERAIFAFRKSNGSLGHGQIIDVWFSSAINNTIGLLGSNP